MGGFLFDKDSPALRGVGDVVAPPPAADPAALDPATGETMADIAPTPAERAVQEDKPITKRLKSERIAGEPVGLGLAGLGADDPVAGDGGLAIGLKGKVLPDSEGKDMLRAGQAMAQAAALQQFRNQSNALAGQVDFYDQLHGQMGEFDQSTMEQIQDLNFQEERKVNEVNQMIAEARTRTVNPAAFYGNIGKGGAFAAAVATAVGHVASALGGGPNEAVNTINAAVDANIRSQELSIQQANLADQQELNLLQQIRAITNSRVQARSVMRAMLLQQAAIQFESMSAQAQRDQIPALKQMALAQLQMQAGQAILDYDKERATEYQIKAKSGIMARRALAQLQGGAAPVAATGPRQPGRGRGQAQARQEATAAEQAEFERQLAEARKQDQAALQGILDTKYSDDPELNRKQRAQQVHNLARERLGQVLEGQAQRGQALSTREAQEMFEQDPILRAGVRSWRELVWDKGAQVVPISSGEKTREFMLTSEGKALTEKDRVSARKDRTAMGMSLDFIDDIDDLQAWTKDAGLEVIRGVVSTHNKLPAKDSSAYEKLSAARQKLFNAINLMRSTYEGGALHGPGEFKIFEDMTNKMNTLERFFAWVSDEGPEIIESSLNILSDSVVRRFHSEITNRGYKTDRLQLSNWQDVDKRLGVQ